MTKGMYCCSGCYRLMPCVTAPARRPSHLNSFFSIRGATPNEAHGPFAAPIELGPWTCGETARLRCTLHAVAATPAVPLTF